MRRKKVFRSLTVTLLFITFIIGCNNREIKNDASIHIDTSNWIKGQKIPEKLIKSIKFIPLETNENCLIGDIKKITVVLDQFYITDRSSNKIFIFNSQGEFLRSIGRYGKGPGELISLSDFIIDDKNGQVLALDGNQRKVLTFNLEDGKFLNDFKIDFFSSDFEKTDDSTLVFYSLRAQEPIFMVIAMKEGLVSFHK